jgi:hypothetical protein
MVAQDRTSEALATIDNFIEALSEPLRADDLAGGWTEQSQAAILAGARSLRERVLAGDLSYSGIARGLDSSGVTDGRLHVLAMKVGAIL